MTYNHSNTFIKDKKFQFRKIGIFCIQNGNVPVHKGGLEKAEGRPWCFMAAALDKMAPGAGNNKD